MEIRDGTGVKAGADQSRAELACGRQSQREREA
jgi:hypothetical protein